MHGGRMRRVIIVQRATFGAPNAYGTVTPAWAAVATLRAELVSYGAAEETVEGSAGASAGRVVQFRTRYLAGITTADRVMFLATAYPVTAVDDESGWGRTLLLTCGGPE